MDGVASYCRQCEGYCGVHAAPGAPDVRPDRDHPLSAGFFCEGGRASLELPRHPSRYTRPMRREGDRLVPIDWEPALREIGDRLGAIRRAAGPRAVAVYAGDPVGASARDVARVAAFALAFGTPNLFTAFAQQASPFLLATERVIGHPVALQSDVARAHYIVLFGGNRDSGQWGPLQAGSVHGALMKQALQRREARLVVVDPRRTALAKSAHVHLPIRPGTDAALLLGMLAGVVRGGTYDEQYVRDYTIGLDDLRDALADWSTERAAAVCGVDNAALAGVTLKFARAAMATAHRGRGMLLSGQGTLASWALVVLHALTANLMRPGGLYDPKGLVDLDPLLAALPSADAPPSRVSGVRPVLMQLPASLLAEEVLTPGDGQVKALVSIAGDPARTAPGAARVEQALAGLDLLVCLDVFPNTATRHAHFVLPIPHFWERDDVHLHDTGLLPARFVQRAAPLYDAPADVRGVADVLGAIVGHARPPWFGGAWGRRLQLFGHALARGDLARWESWAWDLLSDVPRDEVDAAPRGVYRGDVDRSRWRVGHADGRLRLASADMLDAIARYAPEADDDTRPFWLGSRSRTVDRPFPNPRERVDRADVEMHPDAASRLGLADGDAVIVRGDGGEMPGRLVIDPELRADTVIVPYAWGPGTDNGGLHAAPAAVVSATRTDPLTGAPAIAGTRVAVERA